MDILPYELIELIATYLNPITTVNFAMVSKEMHQLLKGHIKSHYQIIHTRKHKKNMLSQLLLNVDNIKSRLEFMYSASQMQSNMIFPPTLCTRECCTMINIDVHFVYIGKRLVQYGVNKYDHRVLHITDVNNREVMIIPNNQYSSRLLIKHPQALNLRFDKCYEKHYDTYYRQYE